MLVYFAIVLVVLMGFCGLAIDVGRMELRTNQLQAAADAGALAAAGELMRSSNTGNAGTAAYNDVVQVENANGIPVPTVGGQLGSTFGFYVGDNSVVEIQLTETFPTYFMGVLSHANSSVTLSVKADAQMPPCLMFMGNPTLTSTYDFWVASSSMHPPIGCPSYYKDGLVIDGFANVAGSQVRTSGAAGSSNLQGWTSYPAIYSVPALPDPLAYITAPAAGTCTNSNPISDHNQSSATTISLTPGTYCGKTAAYAGVGRCNTTSFPITPAIDIQGTQSGSSCPNQDITNGGNCTTTPTVNFSPGLYVIVGGINFNCVTVTGSGVTLYFTKNSSVSFGSFRMVSSTWNVNAPTVSSGGSIAGVSVMCDRNWTPSAAGVTQDFQWTYGTYYADGVLYLTNTGLDAYALSMNAPNYLNMVVANMYNYDAGVNPANNYSTLPAGNPLRQYPTLVQ
jgi:hypothetical protein